MNSAANDNSNTILITGNTFPVKDSLRALGGRWDAASKGWRVPADKARRAQALVGDTATRAIVARSAARAPFGRCMAGDEDGDGSCCCGRPGCHE